MFEIGNSLREARLRHGFEFPELEQRTKIRPKYLRALEDENFEQLPGPTYIRGFLRTYAQCLGLDGQLYVDEYNVRYSSGDEVMARRVSSGAGGAATRRPRPRGPRLERHVVWLALVGIAVITALVIAAWRFGGSGHQSLPLSRGTSVLKPQVAGGLLVRASKGNTLLIVRAGSESGAQRWNGTLTKGEAQRFDARRGLWVYIGSPENVEMRLNGRAVLVGGSKPRSLIVTAGDIIPAGPNS